MKRAGALSTAGSTVLAETPSRPVRTRSYALSAATRHSTQLCRISPWWTRSRRVAFSNALRVNSENGTDAAALSSLATPNVEEEDPQVDEKALLEHIVRSVDSASDAEIDLDGSTDFTESAVDDEEEDLIQVEADKTDESLLLKNCGLSSETLRALEKRGITALFPIQKHVFDPAMEGRDLIGRAKTGSGKTLAFAIPIVESILKENAANGRARRGRAPRALVVAPTRELANQVCREFQSVCPSLSVKPFYGGVSVGGNRRDLAAGVDVAVGTPGRLIDLVEQRALDLSMIRFAILDESDQMLDMGFEEDMEKLLANTPTEKQTMLFSATLPGWVRKIARKYLKNHIVVDLLGDEGTGKISDTITALGILVQGSAKQKMLADLLATYAPGKQSIVFTQTKREADAIHGVADGVISTAVLHGDIAQASREVTLEKFRRGKFSCLVATDVAARGLDIPSVDLVVHYDSPQTHESFVHRSGRTGRAGKTGTTLVMVTKPEIPGFHKIVRASQTSLEMIGPPNPRDVMQASTKYVLEKMQSVENDVIQFFEPAATKLVDNGNGAQVLAAALACMSGFVKVPQPRSLLTQDEGQITLRLLSRPGRLQGFGSAMQVLSEFLGSRLTSVGRYEHVRDVETRMTGFLVDVPAAMAMQILESASTSKPSIKGVQVDRPKALTLEQILDQCPPERGSNRRGGRYGRRSDSYGRYGGRSRWSDDEDGYGRSSYSRGRGRDDFRYSNSGDRRRDGYRNQQRRSYGSRRSRSDPW